MHKLSWLKHLSRMQSAVGSSPTRGSSCSLPWDLCCVGFHCLMRDLLHGNVHVNLYTYVNINILMDK